MRLDQPGGDAQVRLDEQPVELDGCGPGAGEAEVDMGGLVADRYGLVAVFYCLAGIMLFANVLVVLIPKRAA